MTKNEIINNFTEEIYKGLMTNKGRFIDQYGGDAEKVMRGRAKTMAKQRYEKVKETASQSKSVEEILLEKNFQSLIKDALKNPKKVTKSINEAPGSTLNLSKDDMDKLHKNGQLEIDGHKILFKVQKEESINEAPGSTLNLSKDDMDKLHKNGQLEIDGHKILFKVQKSVDDLSEAKKKNYGEKFPKDKFKLLKGKKIKYAGVPQTIIDADEFILKLQDKEGNIKDINYNMFNKKGFIADNTVKPLNGGKATK